ncbi:MAG TPA: flagellar hook protein FlgE [Alcaligenes sp.]|nr:flagellar hook protein FlgE [Alcaligenes sp.]HRL25929.1 flagellar hook protein FlgE [Alcaligenes sp.]
MSFGQGLSGLNAASQNLAAIGNNIANSGTVGYKSSSLQFADVYANSRIGLGVQVSRVNQRFTVGNISGTGGQFDMAIDGANGLFRLQQPNGAIAYSRNGQFFPNKEGMLVNAQGHFLTGYGPGSNALERLQVPSGNIAPKATTAMNLKLNLPADAPSILPFKQALDASGVPQFNPDGTPTYELDGSGNPIPINQFDPKDDTTYSKTFNYLVYDSLGNSHNITQYYVKRPANAAGESVWDVHYAKEGKPLHQATLTFDKSGRLNGNGGADVVSITLPNPGGANSPAAPLTFDIRYTGTTQFNGEFATGNPHQDGYATGEYASMSIDSDGTIVAAYTNGVTQRLGSLVLANFSNLQGLKPIGGNAWTETGASGQPILGRPGENGLATIKGQSVEESNVDMGQELVNMIIAQRTYQANAQTIKTQDQVLQTLVNMR